VYHALRGLSDVCAFNQKLDSTGCGLAGPSSNPLDYPFQNLFFFKWHAIAPVIHDLSLEKLTHCLSEEQLNLLETGRYNLCPKDHHKRAVRHYCPNVFII
jgi:hypothetical protein